MPDSSASFPCQCTTSNVIDCPFWSQRQSITLEVVHTGTTSNIIGHSNSLKRLPMHDFEPGRQPMMLEVVHWHGKLVPEFGFEFMAPISGACVTCSHRLADASPSFFHPCIRPCHVHSLLFINRHLCIYSSASPFKYALFGACCRSRPCRRCSLLLNAFRLKSTFCDITLRYQH